MNEKETSEFKVFCAGMCVLLFRASTLINGKGRGTLMSFFVNNEYFRNLVAESCGQVRLLWQQKNCPRVNVTQITLISQL